MNCSVLVIESDMLMEEIYRKWLTEMLTASSGILVQFCRDLREAEFLLNRNKYDVTILDFLFVQADVSSLIDKFKCKCGTVIVSSVSPKLNKGVLSNAHFSLTKPLDKDLFISTMRNVLNGGLYVNQGTDQSSTSVKVI